MDGDTSEGASPFFLPGRADKLFSLYHRPASPAGCQLELLSAFKGRSLFILSESDNFAIDFKANVMMTDAWERLVEDSKVAAVHLPNADHNSTRKELRDQVSIGTADWIRSLRDPL
jgi:calcineurin-like phosphoesterase family protein